MSALWNQGIRSTWLAEGIAGVILALLAACPVHAKTREEVGALCRDSMDCMARNQPAIRALGLSFSEITKHFLLGHEPQDLAAIDDTHELLRLGMSLIKLLKYCNSGALSRLGQVMTLSSGHYDERSPWVGRKAQALRQLEDRSTALPGLVALSRALYADGSVCKFESGTERRHEQAHFRMIPFQFAAQAEALSREELKAQIARHDPFRPLEGVFESSGFRAGVTYIYDVDNLWNDWNIHVMEDPQGISLPAVSVSESGWVVPPSVVALHELEHVARIRLGTPEKSAPRESSQGHLDELGPVIEQIVLQDKILKKIRGVPLESVETYPCIPIGPGEKPIQLGEMANFFRRLISLHGSVEAALLSPEGLQWLKEYSKASGS